MAPKKASAELVSARAIRRRIFLVRSRQVMLDADLADLYGVETGALTRAVLRNRERFPSDFMFQLTEEDWARLRCQIGISNEGRGGRRYRPRVFSEQGIAMLSSVLRSKQAIAVNVEVMRAFVELRRMAQSYEELANRVDELEREVGAKLGRERARVDAIFKLLREVTLTRPRKQPAGFMPPKDRQR